MFPPKSTEDPTEAVKGLWESISRAGGHLSDQAISEPTEHGMKFVIRLAEAFTEDGKRYAFGFMKAYLLECGWRASRMKVEANGYVTFEVRPASRAR